MRKRSWQKISRCDIGYLYKEKACSSYPIRWKWKVNPYISGFGQKSFWGLRLAKKDYTILIASQKTAKVKRFILSPMTLKIAAGALGILIIVSGFMAYKYKTFKIKVTELQDLRTETRAQQAEIRSFMEKISILEEQLDKLKEMEKKVEQDLK